MYYNNHKQKHFQYNDNNKKNHKYTPFGLKKIQTKTTVCSSLIEFPHFFFSEVFVALNLIFTICRYLFMSYKTRMYSQTLCMYV